MRRLASPSPLGSEFNGFLFASIGEERNGMLLSVVSALARLDVDPWQEAATLARLPGDAATQRLASLIVGLPDWAAAHGDARAVAARLIALLPRSTALNAVSRRTTVQAGAGTNPTTVKYIFIYAICLLSLLGEPSLRLSFSYTR